MPITLTYGQPPTDRTVRLPFFGDALEDTAAALDEALVSPALAGVDVPPDARPWLLDILKEQLSWRLDLFAAAPALNRGPRLFALPISLPATAAGRDAVDAYVPFHYHDNPAQVASAFLRSHGRRTDGGAFHSGTGSSTLRTFSCAER